MYKKQEKGAWGAQSINLLFDFGSGYCPRVMGLSPVTDSTLRQSLLGILS